MLFKVESKFQIYNIYLMIFFKDVYTCGRLVLYVYSYDPSCLAYEPLQEMYENDRRIWNAVFEMVVEDLGRAETEGIEHPDGGKFWPIILGNKGDWSYLATRHFNQLFWKGSCSLCSLVCKIDLT